MPEKDIYTSIEILTRNPGEKYSGYPKVILVHNIESTLMSVASKLLEKGFFPVIFFSTESAVKSWDSSTAIKEAVALMVHKDVGNIKSFIQRIRDTGGELLRTMILSGEFFRGQCPDKCVELASELGVDGGYDPTDRFEGYLPGWITALLNQGLVKPQEMAFRNNPKELVLSSDTAQRRLELLHRTSVNREQEVW